VLAIFVPAWYVFKLPGKIILWKHYMFPNRYGAAETRRQLNSNPILFWYCFKFWLYLISSVLVIPGVLLFIFSLDINSSIVPDSFGGLYYNLYHWINGNYSRWSEGFDYRCLHNFLNWVINSYNWLVTPHYKD